MGECTEKFFAPEFRASPGRKSIHQDQVRLPVFRKVLDGAAGIAPENDSLRMPVGPAAISVELLQSHQDLMGPECAKGVVSQRQRQGAWIQLQSPPLEGWCILLRQCVQQRSAVVPEPDAHIENPQAACSAKPFQLGRSHKFGFCFSERTNGAVKSFVKSLAMKTQASVGSLQRAERT